MCVCIYIYILLDKGTICVEQIVALEGGAGYLYYSDYDSCCDYYITTIATATKRGAHCLVRFGSRLWRNNIEGDAVGLIEPLVMVRSRTLGYAELGHVHLH